MLTKINLSNDIDIYHNYDDDDNEHFEYIKIKLPASFFSCIKKIMIL